MPQPQSSVITSSGSVVLDPIQPEIDASKISPHTLTIPDGVFMNLSQLEEARNKLAANTESNSNLDTDYDAGPSM